MTEFLVSGSWFRVAELRPSLVPGLRLVRHDVRGQVWQVLQEPSGGRQVRLNAPAWDLVGRFDGRDTMGAIWARVLQLRGAAAPTQDEALALLAQLFRAGMVQFDAAPHLSLLFARRAQEGEQRRKGWVNPLFLRTRLADPTHVLDRLAPVGRLVFSPAAGLLWLVVVAWAFMAALLEAGALQAHASRLLQSPSGLALAWVCYPLVKSLHELGHALAVRRLGGEVRDVGLSLLLLTPAPYVDASAANAFPDRRHRALVAASGIAVELALASAALAVWLLVSDGLVRDAALAVAVICSISTLLLNGNPLVRLDGYHVACDLLDLPNLAARSQAWWARQWAALVGAPQGAAPLLAPGERKWLAAYAPLAWIYRLLLFVALVGWVGSHSWLAGWAVALFLLGWLLLGAWRWLGLTGTRGRRMGLAAAAAAFVLLAIVPVPASVVTQGVVWPAPGAQLRAEVDGVVEAVLVPAGAMVAPGDAVLTLSDPALQAAHDRSLAEQGALRAQHHAALLSDPALSVRLAADLARNEAELARARERLALLTVRAGSAGRVVWARPADLPGSHAQRGVLLGHVAVDRPPQIRIALPQEDYGRVRGEVRSVQVRLAQAPGEVLPARLLPGVPGASQVLPSAALGDRQGGPIPVDPADRDGLRTRYPVFALDVALDATAGMPVGQRAWVRLDLPAEPVALQIGRRVRQLLLRQFDTGGAL